MGSSFRTPDSCGSDVVHPAGVPANRFPMSALADSTVRIFGDTAVLMGKVEMQGEQKSEIIPMTTVFPKQGADWQVPAIHVLKAQAESALRVVLRAAANSRNPLLSRACLGS